MTESNDRCDRQQATENGVMDSRNGQMSIFDFIEGQEKPEMTKEEAIKPLIDSRSLTWHRTICPYCKFDNPDSPENHNKSHGQNIHLQYWLSPLDFCPNCGKKYDRDHPKIVMSKDYAECKKLGLKGAVRKNEKGQWEESPLNRFMTKEKGY